MNKNLDLIFTIAVAVIVASTISYLYIQHQITNNLTL